MISADDWIEMLHLKPHPEGGYYRRSFSSAGSLSRACLGGDYGGDRPFATAIYYLLKGDEFAALHRLKSEELWHFYTGSALTLHVIDDERHYLQLRLGEHLEAGESFQAMIRANWWFGATVDDPLSYTLVGCTVSPGFNFADFELAERESLISCYPEHADLIARLTP
jgi:predicted cupin superfamily sugar epimerase